METSSNIVFSPINSPKLKYIEFAMVQNQEKLNILTEEEQEHAHLLPFLLEKLLVSQEFLISKI